MPLSDFDADLAADLDDVFFDDFAVSALVERDGSDLPAGVRVFVSAGITRVVGDRYVKAAYEIRAQIGDGLKVGDVIKILDSDGLEAAQYRIREPLDRDAVMVLHGADKL